MVLAPLLITLAFLMAFLVLYALAQSSNVLGEAIVKIVQHTVGRFPIVGRFISHGVEWAAQAISDVLGRAAAGMQHRVGGLFHTLAHVVSETGEKIAAAHDLIFRLSTLLPTFAPLGRLYDLWKAIDRLRSHTAKADHALAKQVAQGKAIANSAAHTGAGALVKAQAIPADVVLPRDLAPIRERIKALEDELAELWKRARGIPIPAVAGIGLGALAFALGRLGAGYVRCNAATSLFRKRGCNGWRKLDDVLGLLADVVVITNVCKIIRWLEVGASTIAVPLVSALTPITAGLCAADSSRPPKLDVPEPHLHEPVGFSLHLP